MEPGCISFAKGRIDSLYWYKPKHYKDKETVFQYLSALYLQYTHINWVVGRMGIETEKSVHLVAAARLPPKITKSIYVP